jgi:hypothetical protein
MNDYILHLVECQCMLSIFKNKSKPVYHKIPVFSILKDDEVERKYIICENCNVVHEVCEISKSEIKWGSEGIESLVKTFSDIKFNLESLGFERLISVLEKEDLHISKWELIEHCLENNLEENIVLQKTEHDNNIVVRLLEIKDQKFKLRKEMLQRYF